MTYEFNLIYALWAAAGLILGLIIGNLTWGRAARRHARVADSVANAAAAAAARTDAEHSSRELAAMREQLRPLADEIDKLKRELAKAKRPATDLVPAAALAGTGPLVAATSVDVRQLKGVGDKFAAALAVIGLASVPELARLSTGDAADADTRLGVFNGRIARDKLVEQSVLLDEGRTTEYEARFGKLSGSV